MPGYGGWFDPTGKPARTSSGGEATTIKVQYIRKMQYGRPVTKNTLATCFMVLRNHADLRTHLTLDSAARFQTGQWNICCSISKPPDPTLVMAYLIWGISDHLCEPTRLLVRALGLSFATHTNDINQKALLSTTIVNPHEEYNQHPGSWFFSIAIYITQQVVV